MPTSYLLRVAVSGGDDAFGTITTAVQDVWTSYDVYFVSGINSGTYNQSGTLDFIGNTDTYEGSGVALQWVDDPPGQAEWSPWYADNGNFGIFEAGLWYHVDHRFSPGAPPTEEFWLDGVDQGETTSGTTTDPVVGVSFGQFNSATPWPLNLYLKNLTVGTSKGATDIWDGDLSSGVLATAFDTVTISGASTLQILDVSDPVFDDFESGLGQWTTVSGSISTSTDYSCDGNYSLKCTTVDAAPYNCIEKNNLPNMGDDLRWIWTSFSLRVEDWADWWQGGLAMDPRIWGIGSTAYNQYLEIEPLSNTTGYVQFAPFNGLTTLIDHGQWNSIVVGIRSNQTTGDLDRKLIINGNLEIDDTVNFATSIGNPIDFISLGDRNDSWGGAYTNKSFYLDKFTYQTDIQLDDITCSAIRLESTASVTNKSATLSAEVNPEGISSTAYFEYGLDTSYGTTTTPQNIGSGTDYVAVQEAISNLTPGRVYYFRAVRNP